MGDPVPRDYVQTLDLLKEQVRSARFTAQRRVNTELVRLYWRIGAIILDRQRRSGWGSGVVARLAADLRTAFPSMKGFSPRNLAYMRAFARALQDPEDLQQPVARLPWGHITVLLSRFDDRSRRDWYAERAVHRISDTLRELGNGFAFVGRQVHFDVGGDDFFVDLLFFHVDQLRYVVIELKTGKFRPEQLGQLSFYVAVVDDRLRRSTHAETVGLLLVAGKNESTVRYSLGAHQSPVGVATYDLLPEDVRDALPSEHELEGLLAASVGD